MPATDEPALKAPAPELVSLQSIRGIAAVIVVLWHATYWQKTVFPLPTTLPPVMAIGEFGVDLFFVISGFIMMYITPRPFRAGRDQLAFLARRFVRIYPPYWVVLGLFCLIKAALHFPPSFKGGYMVVANILLLPTFGFAENVVPAWTLVYEVFFYVVVSFIFYGHLKVRLGAIALWGLVIFIVGIHLRSWNGNVFLFSWASCLSFEFMGGMLLVVFLNQNRVQLESPAALGCLAVLLCLAFGVAIWFGPFGLHFQSPWRLLGYGIPAILIVGLVLQMELQGEWKWTGLLAPIGDRSYSIYLVHWPVFRLLFWAAAALPIRRNWLDVGLVILAGIALIAAAAEVSYRFVEKPSHNLGKRLIVHFKRR